MMAAASIGMPFRRALRALKARSSLTNPALMTIEPAPVTLSTRALASFPSASTSPMMMYFFPASAGAPASTAFPRPTFATTASASSAPLTVGDTAMSYTSLSNIDARASTMQSNDALSAIALGMFAAIAEISGIAVPPGSVWWSRRSRRNHRSSWTRRCTW